jgi:hypothetical protein
VKDIFALDFLSEYLTLFKYALNCLVMSLLCLYHHDGICSSPQDGCELHWMLTSLVQSLDALCELFQFLSNLPNPIAITFLAYVTLAPQTQQSAVVILWMDQFVSLVKGNSFWTSRMIMAQL